MLSRFLVLSVALLIASGSLVARSFAFTRQSTASTSSTTHSSTSKTKAAQSRTSSSKTAHKTAASKKRRRSPRVQRMHQAFVASASLKPMARQLLQERTPAGYAGVEAYARRHAKDDAGALAWLVLGYAHVLDHDYAKAIDPLSRARAKAGDLGDYVSYYLASSYLQTGRSAETVATLADFSKIYPDSLVIKDAHVVYAGALIAEGRAAEAVALLESDREPVRADVELGLGRAYAVTGQTAKAVTALRNVYYNMPTSPEADTANTELKKLSGVPRLSAIGGLGLTCCEGPAVQRCGQRISRSSGRSKSRRPASTQLALATALQKSGRNKDAKQILASVPDSSPDVVAHRLFLLGEVARATDDQDGFLSLQAQLRQTSPNSPWLEQSLLATGNMYLLKRDYDHAIDAYRELQQRFPNGSRASYAHWKVAWLSSRQGRAQDAKQGFEEQISLYPASGEVPAALYWRARYAKKITSSPRPGPTISRSPIDFAIFTMPSSLASA